MARRIAVGIDIGTHQVKVVIASRDREEPAPRILGVGMAESKGLRHGYIINSTDVSRSIRKAVLQAEKTAGMKVKSAYLGIGGVGLDEVTAHGEMTISRADSEVSDFDISKVQGEAEKKIASQILNRRVLHAIPLHYAIDGSEVLGHPQGMKGAKLEVDMLFVTCLERHLEDIISAVEALGIEVEDVMASPIAGSLVTLTKAQKIAGVVLANIGAETVSIIIFENNVPISLKVFPTGASDITNDIALGLKVSIEEAEQIKRGALTGTEFPKKKLDAIIISRLSDLFELIQTHLKKIGKKELLPAGVVITGGGSGLATIEDIARASLALPSKIGALSLPQGSMIKDSTWAVSYGLCIWGLSAEQDSFGIALAKQTGGSVWGWLKQFLP